jgi:multidrug efflux pump subunit AcrB
MKLPKVHKGMAGKLAETFILSKLTPISILLSLLLGFASIYLTPKEEEPQIIVPMIDVLVPSPGLTAEEVEIKVTGPLERSLWGLDGVEYLYASSMDNAALLTVRFEVNNPLEPSLVKVHHKVTETMNQLPSNVQAPHIQSFSVDDVPFLAVSFSSSTRNDYELRQLIAPLAKKLSSTENIAKTELLGGRKRSIRVIVDNDKIYSKGVSLEDIEKALKANHMLMPAGKNWSNSEVYDITVGAKIKNTRDVENIAVGVSSGKPVLIKDIANVIDGPEARVRQSLLFNKDTQAMDVVTLSFAKRKGTNVVELSKDILLQIENYKENLPQDIKMTILRDYGKTAGEKSHELIEHLIIATVSVSILIALAMGIRAALVVAIAIPVTLALTLATYYFMGYTLNRVTLFALIFSIGILVDDAIVVVENIERYLKTYPKLSIVQATLRAVSEVGNPTILATFTVIGAIMPMAFVRGLMGPYMKPIPVGASIAMLLSLFIAFIVTPWASVKLLNKHDADEHGHTDEETCEEAKHSKLDQAYIWITGHLLDKKSWALGFVGLSVFLFLITSSLVTTKNVKVKMLPFDNKSEFQVLVDYPTTTSLNDSIEMSKELANQLMKNENVKTVQVFAGEPAPFSFSGMVKHTFMRSSEYMNDLHIVLTHKSDRSKSGHEITNELRPIIKAFGDKNQAITKVLEIPPGPPVMATMVAEVYAPTREMQKQAALEIKGVFEKHEMFVDIDSTLRKSRPTQIIPYLYDKGAKLGTSAYQAWSMGSLIFQESSIGTIDDPNIPEAVSINLSIKNETRSGDNPFANQYFASMTAGTVEAKEVLGDSYIKETRVLHRKNLKPVEYVLSELAGSEEAPVYGMLDIQDDIKFPTVTAKVPNTIEEPIIKWDGEWFITYEVFRDLGAAFAVVLVLIYILVVGWFRSFLVPLVIMLPIPISLIGILPGHWIMGAYFTATSMIGFIAGAGVIVRNSIILVDFIEHQIQNGHELKEAVINAGVLRFRPMLLTASAVVAGSSIMLFDPIFQGLAISLIFGEVAATLLSRFAVPLVYYWLIGKQRFKELTEANENQDMWYENGK